jgi:hypothetical protein
MARRAGRRGGEAKAATGCDELEGATVQPGMASSLHPCGGRGRSNTRADSMRNARPVAVVGRS